MSSVRERGHADRLAVLASSVAQTPMSVRLDGRDRAVVCSEAAIRIPQDVGAGTELLATAIAAAMVRVGSLPAPFACSKRVARRYETLEMGRATRWVMSSLPGLTPRLHVPTVLPDTADCRASLELARSHGPIATFDSGVGLPITMGRRAPVRRPSRKSAQRREASTTGLVDSPALRRLRKLLGGDQSTTSGGASAARAGRVSLLDPRRPTHDAILADVVERAHLEDPATTPRGTLAQRFHYPEYDSGQGSYRAEWVTLYDLPGTSGTPLPAPSEHGLRVLRKALGSFGMARSLTGPRRDGEELDVDRAVERAVDRHEGRRADDRLYLERDRCRRDAAVFVLLDATASTAGGESDSEPFEEYRRASLAVVRSLLDLGFLVSAASFSGQGRSDVQIRRLLSFHERRWEPMRARAGGLEPGGYTRTGAAVRHAHMRLAATRVAELGLIVLSDGFSFDHEYEGDYARADVAASIREGLSIGIPTVLVDPVATTRQSTQWPDELAPALRGRSLSDLARSLGSTLHLARRAARREHAT